MTTSLNTLSSKDLRRAADLRDQIDAAQSELDAILSGTPVKGKPGRKPGAKPGPKPKAKKKAKSKMSDAGRARIVAAQKKRWAAKRKADKAAAKAAK